MSAEQPVKVMSNDEMRDALRPLEQISFDLARLIEFGVFSGVGQQYTVEYKKQMLERALKQVQFIRK